jgi:hypothetical protein
MRIRNAEGQALPLKPGAKPFLVGKLFLTSVFHSAGHAETSRGIAMSGKFSVPHWRWPISTFVSFMAQNLRQEERAVEKRAGPANARPEQERHNLLADPKKGTCARSVHMDSFAAVPETYHERLKPAKRTCKERRAESIEQ